MTMTEVEKTPQQQSKTGQSLPVQQLTGILLADGWHDITNCEKIEFSVSSSPATDGPYTFLKYQDYNNNDKNWVYTPFSQISGYRFKITG